MSRIAIWTHQGMGDFIICNAIFRHFAKRYDLVIVPAKYPNAESVRCMVQDEPNIVVRPFETEADGLAYMREIWPRMGGDTLWLGGLGKNFQGADFDQCFYRQAKVSFQLRWDDWKIERNIAKEVPVPDFTYRFMHGDAKRGFGIDSARTGVRFTDIGPDPAKSSNIFAWTGIVLGAEEIHCIDSSFALLADSLPLKPTRKLFLHRYARPSETIPTYRHDWQILI